MLLKNLRGKRRGFTFVEVMVAVCILVVGVVFVYESFLHLVGLYDYYSRYMALAPQMNEALAQIQYEIRCDGKVSSVPSEGEFIVRGRAFAWSSFVAPLDGERKLYLAEIKVSWQEDRKARELVRTAYALYTPR